MVNGFLIAALILFFLVISVGIYNYLSGKRLIRDLLHYLKLNARNLTEWDAYHSAIEKECDIVVSLTTIPERTGDLDLVLKSLLYQSIKPKSINIYIPYYSYRNGLPYSVPDVLNTLDNVQVHRVESDYGPSTKFIPVLESYPESQRILVVDDDNIYPPNYLEQFERASQEQPDMILAGSGWRVPDDLTDRPTTLWTNIFKKPPTPVPGTRISQLYPVDVVQGYSGYLVKSAFIDMDAVKDFSTAPEALRFVDDVWLSAHSLVPKAVFPMQRYCYTPFFKNHIFKSSSLAKINNRNKSGYEYRNNTIGIRYFEDLWLTARNENPTDL